VMQRRGLYPAPPGASPLPGLEVAGEIVEGDFGGDNLCGGANPCGGDNPWGLQAGDRVCALLTGGGYAEYAVAPLALCLPIPAGLDEVQAASLPETFFTVWSNVFDRARLGHGEGGADEVLLVHGGSSGIGVPAIQLATAFGHRVLATAGTAAKCEACESLGAERAINYREEDFVEVARAATIGRGVDVILDMVAGDYLPRDLKVLADGGRIVIIGLQGGAKTQLPLVEILTRRLTITGSTLRPRPVAFKQRIAAALVDKVWPLLESGRVRPLIHSTFPATEAAAAHALMENSEHIGKIVLTW
jgi:NADPH2:quinone reductase